MYNMTIFCDTSCHQLCTVVLSFLPYTTGKQQNDIVVSITASSKNTVCGAKYYCPLRRQNIVFGIWRRNSVLKLKQHIRFTGCRRQTTGNDLVGISGKTVKPGIEMEKR